MSYLAKITPIQTTRSADDFQCGWSVMRMLAELSLQSPPKAPKRVVSKTRTAKPVVGRTADRAGLTGTDRV